MTTVAEIHKTITDARLLLTNAYRDSEPLGVAEIHYGLRDLVQAITVLEARARSWAQQEEHASDQP